MSIHAEWTKEQNGWVRSFYWVVVRTEIRFLWCTTDVSQRRPPCWGCCGLINSTEKIQQKNISLGLSGRMWRHFGSNPLECPLSYSGKLLEPRQTLDHTYHRVFGASVLGVYQKSIPEKTNLRWILALQISDEVWPVRCIWNQSA